MGPLTAASWAPRLGGMQLDILLLTEYRESVPNRTQTIAGLCIGATGCIERPVR